MKILTAGAALLLTTSMAHAVGLDRSDQDITAIFEDGNYVELSFGSVRPSLSGVDDIPLAAGAPAFAYDGAADDFNQIGGSVTYRLNDAISLALIFDQPFGVDILYPGTGTTSLLGNTEARLDSNAITAMARYRFDDTWSVHGGVVVEQMEAYIRLRGLAYAARDPSTGAVVGSGLNGYDVTLRSNTATGFVIGSAYERPDIALRVALTYHSAIEHRFDTVEMLPAIGQVSAPGAITTVETPESWNIDFQTGIAENTLLFGQIRYADYDDTLVSPAFFAAQTGGRSLTAIDSDFPIRWAWRAGSRRPSRPRSRSATRARSAMFPRRCHQRTEITWCRSARSTASGTSFLRAAFAIHGSATPTPDRATAMWQTLRTTTRFQLA